MDAKSKANFINSVAGGQGIPCPKCNTLNEADSKFCIACGTPLTQKKPEAAVPFPEAEPTQQPFPEAEPTQQPFPEAEPAQQPFPAAEPAQQPFPEAEPAQQPFPAAEPTRKPVRPKPVQPKPKQAEQPKPAEPTVKYIEPESAFAEGLPSWDIEPPQVVVRRKRR